MIQSLMLGGTGLLLGCLLMLPFFPLVHGRAVRLTTRRINAATPMAMSEIQADKDQLRAEFAMSVRRLEIGVEAMRTRAVAHSADKRNAEISRLQVELDKKTAMILALNAREQVRKSMVRRVVKLLLYLRVRLRRRQNQRSFTPELSPTWELVQQPQRFFPQPERSDLQVERFAPQPERSDLQVERFAPQPERSDPQIERFPSRPEPSAPERSDLQPESSAPQPERPDLQPKRFAPQLERAPQRERPDPQPERLAPEVERSAPQPERSAPQLERFPQEADHNELAAAAAAIAAFNLRRRQIVSNKH
jgi:hypothetical protein